MKLDHHIENTKKCSNLDFELDLFSFGQEFFSTTTIPLTFFAPYPVQSIFFTTLDFEHNISSFGQYLSQLRSFSQYFRHLNNSAYVFLGKIFSIENDFLEKLFSFQPNTTLI